MLEKYARIGATQLEIAGALGVSTAKLERHLKASPDVRADLKRLIVSGL
jgi:hypothetical protein